MRLFVGNIGYIVTEQEFADFLRELGVTVRIVKILKDRETGNSRGFGFVEVDGDHNDAISKIDGTLLRGRPLHVQVAKEQSPRPPSSAPPTVAHRKSGKERGERRGVTWDDVD